MKRVISSLLLLSLSSPAFAASAVPPQVNVAQPIAATQSVEATAVTTQVTPNVAMTEDEAEKLIQIDRNPIPLSSHLKKKYSAYKMIVTSRYPGKLNVVSAALINGTLGTQAADATSTSYVNVLWGLPLIWLGIGIAALVISGKNNKAEHEGAAYPNQVPTSTLAKGESLTFNTLVPIGQNPQVKLSFLDPKVNLEFSKNSN